jgi:hypothetical protein
MKRTIFLLAVACFPAAFFPGQTSAQGIQNPGSFVGSQTQSAPIQTIAFSYKSFDAATSTESEISAINIKAIKDFKGRFAEAKDEKWFTLKDGFMSYFTLDGYGVRACYDKKGRWQYSLRFSSENKLPHDIRAVVKSTYYDFTITIVETVEVPGQRVYLVHLEDATQIKIVRVSEEGEMSVLQEYTKG